jgi:biotin-dependent carboxylase-like uncharacterized protein
MIEVRNGGIEVLVEDWPGRLGYMGRGMAASGAMDGLAAQLGNRLVANPLDAAVLEIAGGYAAFEFTEPHVIALTGADMGATLNGSDMPTWETVAVQPGDVLSLSHFRDGGFRSYLAVAGGIDVPVYLGSRSTCVFGEYGGLEGRKLEKGDLLATLPVSEAPPAGRRVADRFLPEYPSEWVVRTVPGPNSAPDYVTARGMDHLFGHPMRISHNANRAAYRLEELPAFFWARPDGGAGGSHPSNIVDHGYNMRGAINVTGDTPSILTADGPTLGGFVCVGGVINADLWKIGQGVPSKDTIRFEPSTPAEAAAARLERTAALGAEDLIVT